MKKINVVAAIIIKDNKIFVTQRGYGEFKDKWEFPGGKIEENETPTNALIREIKEELDASISVNEFLCDVEYDYETFHLSMKCFICSLNNLHLELLEHENAKWVKLEELDNIDFLPADIYVKNALFNKFQI